MLSGFDTTQTDSIDASTDPSTLTRTSRAATPSGYSSASLPLTLRGWTFTHEPLTGADGCTTTDCTRRIVVASELSGAQAARTAPHEAAHVLPQGDEVVIDTPPAMGLVTLAALAAADTVVAAVACETEAYDQLGRLVQVIDQRIAARMRPGQRVHWIVPTRHDARRLLDREVVELLTEQFPGRVTTPVREAVSARVAYTAGQPVSIYAPGSGIAADYAAALASIIGPDPRPAGRHTATPNATPTRA